MDLKFRYLTENKSEPLNKNKKRTRKVNRDELINTSIRSEPGKTKLITENRVNQNAWNNHTSGVNHNRR